MSRRIRQVSPEPFQHRPWSPARAWAIAQGLPRLAAWLGVLPTTLRCYLGSRQTLPPEIAADLSRASHGMYSPEAFMHKAAQHGPRAQPAQPPHKKPLAARAQRV